MLTELIQRLESASEGSRELDGAIWWQVNRKTAERVYWRAATGLPRPLPAGKIPAGLGRLAVEQSAPEYSRSIDAALTLARSILPPTKRIGLVEQPDQTWEAAILCVEPDEGPCLDSVAPTAALSLVIAALKARSALAQADGGRG